MTKEQFEAMAWAFHNANDSLTNAVNHGQFPEGETQAALSRIFSALADACTEAAEASSAPATPPSQASK